MAAAAAATIADTTRISMGRNVPGSRKPLQSGAQQGDGAQQLARAGSVRDATIGGMRRVARAYFGELTDTVFLEMRFETKQQFGYAGTSRAIPVVNAQVCAHERTNEPGPRSARDGGARALHRGALHSPMITGLSRRQCTDARRDQEIAFDDAHSRARPFSINR